MDRCSRSQSFFVCASLNSEFKLIINTIAASDSNEAASLFEKEFKIKPSNIEGPFLKKKIKKNEDVKSIQFDGAPKKAIYDGWIVNSFSLKEPKDSAFIVFLKRVDGSSKDIPKGTTILPINNLRFI